MSLTKLEKDQLPIGTEWHPFSEAPTDGRLYGRQDEEWAPVEDSGVQDVLVDGISVVVEKVAHINLTGKADIYIDPETETVVDPEYNFKEIQKIQLDYVTNETFNTTVEELNTDIDQVASDLATAETTLGDRIDAEVSRATTREGQLATSISSETSRATAAEQLLTSTKVAKSGDTMTGPLTLSGQGTQDRHPVTVKQLQEALSQLESQALTFKGFISTTAPTGDIREGNFWYQAASEDTTFPWNVYTYTSGAWSTTTTEYTPLALDLWSRVSDEAGMYYLGSVWERLDFAGSTFNSNQFEVVDGVVTLKPLGITNAEIATNAEIDQSKIAGLVGTYVPYQPDTLSVAPKENGSFQIPLSGVSHNVLRIDNSPIEVSTKLSEIAMNTDVSGMSIFLDKSKPVDIANANYKFISAVNSTTRDQYFFEIDPGDTAGTGALYFLKQNTGTNVKTITFVYLQGDATEVRDSIVGSDCTIIGTPVQGWNDVDLTFDGEGLIVTNNDFSTYSPAQYWGGDMGRIGIIEVGVVQVGNTSMPTKILTPNNMRVNIVEENGIQHPIAYLEDTENEFDPVFTTWKNGVQIVAGQGASSAEQSSPTVAIGQNSNLKGSGGIAIGYNASDYESGDNFLISMGYNAQASNRSVAIGQNAKAENISNFNGTSSIAIGPDASTKSNSIAIGEKAKVTMDDTSLGSIASIQLGSGTNATPNTFQVWDYPMLNKITGKIPADRIPFPAPPARTVTNVTEMFTPSETLRWLVAELHEWKGDEYSYVVLRGNRAQSSGSLTINVAKGYGSEDNLTFTKSLTIYSGQIPYEVSVSVETEEEASVITFADGFSGQFEVFYEVGVGVKPSLSHYLDANGIVHVFTSSTTPISTIGPTYDSSWNAGYTINGEFVLVSNVKELVFGEDYNDVTVLSGALSGVYLDKLILPKNLVSITDGALSSVNLSDLVLPDSVEEIGDGCIMEVGNWESLTNRITLSASLKTVSANGLRMLSEINEINIKSLDVNAVDWPINPDNGKCETFMYAGRGDKIGVIYADTQALGDAFKNFGFWNAGAEVPTFINWTVVVNS